MPKKIDTKKIEECIREIIVALGDDPDREGLLDTPKRVSKMYEEVFQGMTLSNREIAEAFGTTFENEDYEFNTAQYDDVLKLRAQEAQNNVNQNSPVSEADKNNNENTVRTINAEKPDAPVLHTQNPKEGEIIYGKMVKDNIVPIRELNADSGTVIIAGDVFGFSIKETKDKLKYIISFNVTDYDSSIRKSGGFVI
jgi:DNA polymerase III alpha subunit (gram-positive type)